MAQSFYQQRFITNISVVLAINFLLVLLPCCTNIAQEKAKVAKPIVFNELWYQGKAEITSYKLSQARYGEIHEGTAAMVFVTEEFSYKKHVKLDNPAGNKEDAVPVLKLNHTRKFNTGIYPYSMMISVFTPVQNNEHALKVTSSSQEWCGHTFSQIDRQPKSYKVIGHSYFESEGEKNIEIDLAHLEDELWAKIRIDPMSLPQGNLKVIPGQMFLRLRHQQIKPYKAEAVLDTNPHNSAEWEYRITYEGLQRELVIHFDKEFPYVINGWSEKTKSGFDSYAEILETKAIKMKQIWTDYWSQNSIRDYSKYTSLFESPSQRSK